MIYLEQTVNQILREEGQTIISLEDLQISWEDVENLFIGVYEQSKQYITIYDWVEDTLSTTKQQRPDYAHIKHITYNAYNNMQRFMPDMPRQYWEFNPYTKNANSLINTNFSLEVAKYPTLENLSYNTNLNVKKEQKVHFLTPCNFYPETLQFADFICYEHCTKPNTYIIEGENGVGSFDTKTLRGYIVMDKDYSGELKITSKFLGIRELDLTCELFYIWFKAALLQYIGAMKKQFDLTGVGLPFDINADNLLERGRQLMDYVETLKGTKSHWSNF